MGEGLTRPEATLDKRFGGRIARKAIIAATIAVMLLSLALTAPRAGATPSAGIHNIQHVVMIMQENRSFDSILARSPGQTGFLPVCVSQTPRLVDV